MTKGSIHEEDITIINIYAPNIGAPQYVRQMLTSILYAEYIKRNAGLEEAQAGIKIAGRSVNNLRCADDTTLMVES